MGRCYEFGVLVGEGCEHAMVVPESGGRCECATCAVVCTGKFAACTAIIDQSGYVPVTAPAWAVAVGRREPAPATAPSVPSSPAAGADPPPPPRAPLAAPVSSLAGPADTTELIEAVAKQLAEHDVDLVTRIDALAEQVAELQRQNAAQAAALQTTLTQLGTLVTRLDAARPAPLFGFPRRQS